MSDAFIGIDVGGTNFRLGVVQDLQVVWEKRFQADFSGVCRRLSAVEALDTITATLNDAVTEARMAYPSIRAIGIGFPGFIDPASHQVISSPNLPGLSNADIITPLEQCSGLSVVLENDASAAAYGEFALSQKSDGDLIYMGLGTGVGGGLVLQSKLHGGVHGVAMEVGHITVERGGRLCGCGNRGCLEQYASTNGVVQTYVELTGKTLSAFDIAQAVLQHDDAAVKAFEQAGEYLASALAHIAKVVDVGDVVVGGGMSASWSLMQAAFERRLNEDLIPTLRGKVKVRISQAQDQAGIIGAAMLARRHG
ncbi:MAG: ROK family protein [Sideroxydans sp.]|nr:ROK family protein [Sideroxydans sp.]